MLNEKGKRELAYVVAIKAIEPIVGSDNCEAAIVGGWKVMVRKGTFKPNDLAVYFEIDSQVPAIQTFAFLEPKHYKVRTQKYTFGGKNPGFYSQGLLMTPSDFGWYSCFNTDGVPCLQNPDKNKLYPEGYFLTEELGVTYYDPLDRARKSDSEGDKYQKMARRMGKRFSKQPYRWLMKRTWGKKLLYLFFGHTAKKNSKAWPDGRFAGVSRTDQERVENRPWVLEDKTPYIVTQKCDGSSGTFILEKKPFGKYEFYVCSRNVRMLSQKQECYYGEHNYYWEVALNYDIENKMKKWLKENNADWVCWQGEVCAPQIQKNPQGLTKTHLFCFHWTDSIEGRLNIVEAAKRWKEMEMEVVPIVDDNYILPDDMEEFKLSAEGKYDASVCEGKTDCDREGFVYYKSTDPTFSFKNVSRSYLLKH